MPTMRTRCSDLAALLAPISTQHFFSAYWEQQALHIQRDNRDYYAELITLTDVQHILAEGGLRYPAVQLSKGGAFINPDVFCQNIRAGSICFDGVPDLAKLQHEYQSGASLSLPGFNRAWRPLMELTANIEALLSHAVHCNIYITPGNSRGFTPHYDAHEVLILQISGSKHWRICPAPIDLPHHSQAFHPDMPIAEQALMELELQAGDLLYLPRGFIHSAYTGEQASMHVTLGITPYTYIELLSTWLQSAKQQADLRRSLPPGFADDPASHAEIARQFYQTANRFAQNMQAESLVAEFARRVQAGYPGRSSSGRCIDLAISVIEAHTYLQVLASTQYRLINNGEELILEFADKTMRLPLAAQAILEAMISRAVFTSEELPGAFQLATKLALTRSLYQEGFLSLRD
jgi:Cupin superfamily protein